MSPTGIQSLQNSQLRFTQADCLNDPFELAPYIGQLIEGAELQLMAEEVIGEPNFKKMTEQVIHEELEKMPRAFRRKLAKMKGEDLVRSKLLSSKKRMEAKTHLIDTVHESAPEALRRIRKQLKEDFGVLCLTESPDNKLMWAHYAASHQGFVVEFDSLHSFFGRDAVSPATIGHLHPVTYTKDRPKIEFLVSKDNDVASLFFTKPSEWAYEREWRMVRSVKDATTKTNTDQGDTLYLFEFPSEIIRRIFLGHRMSADNRSAIFDLLSSRRYSHVEVFEAVPGEKEFEFEMKKVLL